MLKSNADVYVYVAMWCSGQSISLEILERLFVQVPLVTKSWQLELSKDRVIRGFYLWPHITSHQAI